MPLVTKAFDLGLRAVAQPRRATAAHTLNIAHKKEWRERASHPASQLGRQPGGCQPARARRPAASQAACREAVPAALVNQKLHTDIANLRHVLIDFKCLPKNGNKNVAVFRQATA